MPGPALLRPHLWWFFSEISMGICFLECSSHNSVFVQGVRSMPKPYPFTLIPDQGSGLTEHVVSRTSRPKPRDSFQIQAQTITNASMLKPRQRGCLSASDYCTDFSAASMPKLGQCSSPAHPCPKHSSVHGREHSIFSISLPKP